MLSCSMNSVILDVFEQDESRFFYPLRGQATARDFVRALHGRGVEYSTLCAEIGEAEQNFASWRKGLGRNGIGQRVMDRINQPLAQVLLSDDEDDEPDVKKTDKRTATAKTKKPPTSLNSLQMADQKAMSGDIVRSWIDQLDGRMGALDEPSTQDGGDTDDDDEDEWNTPPADVKTAPVFSNGAADVQSSENSHDTADSRQTNGTDNKSSSMEHTKVTTTTTTTKYTKKETTAESNKVNTASTGAKEKSQPTHTEKAKSPPVHTEQEQTPPTVQRNVTPSTVQREVTPPAHDTGGTHAASDHHAEVTTVTSTVDKQGTVTPHVTTNQHGTGITTTEEGAADTSDSDSYPDTSDTDLDDADASNHCQVALAALDRDLRAYRLPAAIRSSDCATAVLDENHGYMYVLSDSAATAATHRVLVGVTERRLERLLDIATVYNVDITLVAAVTITRGQLAIASREFTNRLSEHQLRGHAGWFMAPISEVLKCVGDVAIKYSPSSSNA